MKKFPLLAMALAAFSPAAASAADQWLVYFGCYTNAKTNSKGILVSKFDSAAGILTEPVTAVETKDPSFLAIHPSGKTLYAVGEGGMPGAKGGAVSAFSINRSNGTLTPVNQVDSVGNGPCYISLDATGVMAMVANYGGGSVASYQVLPDGSLKGPATFVQHEGSGPDQGRQKGPHGHSINPAPGNRFALACDLGIDQVITYRMKLPDGTLEASSKVATPPGGGPRHLAFHPSGKFVFVNNEMGMSVSTYSYAADTGVLQLVDTVSTLPPADQGKKGYSTAETVAHPNGRTVYVSNRTHDTIAVFQCDPGSGRLELIQNAPAEGKIPRNFSLDPTGKWMIVAHQDSNTAAVLKVDPETGKLSSTGRTVPAGGAVCVRFLAAE